MASTNPDEPTLPDDIITKLKSNIRNLLNCKQVCGVCLSNTKNLRLGSTVYSISCGENISERSLQEIIGFTFGHKITSLLPTCYFCEHCIDVILKAYRMLEEIKFNHHILQNYANKLMEQAKLRLPDDVQSIVFQLEYPSDPKTENHTKSNHETGVTDDEENSCTEILLMPEPIKEETDIDNEPKDKSGNLITVEISEIVAKIKDQITFKRLKADSKFIHEDVPKSAKATVKRKTIGKRKLDADNKKDNDDEDSNARYYKCYLCATTFTGQSELLKHSKKECIERSKETFNRTLKENSAKKEVCDQCGKVIASRYLKKHKRLHESKQKQCSICSQFINKASFNRHMFAHSGLPKMRHCPHCDYESKYSEALDAHINKEHLFLRPYTCEKCQKSFHSKLLLREHVRIHTRLKTEQCHVCGDRFAYKKSLVLHMRIHTGYTPYKCDLCDAAFLSASRRQAHVQTKHIGRTLQCDHCLKKFSLRTTLRSHMIKVHQQNHKVSSTR